MADKTKLEQKQVADVGTYQICFKSGATVVLENAELYATFFGNEPQVWHFRRDGKPISFTAHFANTTGYGEKPLDEVIDAIVRLK
jgi:hypothetical protein